MRESKRTEYTKSVEDMLVHLSQEVAKLNREVLELQAGKANRGDVEKFAETATQAELTAKKASEDILALAYDIDELKRKTSDDGDLAKLGAEVVRVVIRRLERVGIE